MLQYSILEKQLDGIRSSEDKKANSIVRIEQQPQEQESEENEEPRIMTDSTSPREGGED
jgi:hypothetical protein